MKNRVYSLDELGIGTKHRAFVVAEISGNHGGNLDIAKELILAAAQSGADAVKFQTYTADTLSIDSKNLYFKIPENSPWESFGNQYALYKESYTPWSWFPELYSTAKDLGLVPFSSPFDVSAVDFLEELDTLLYKIASPEINHIPLVQRIAETGKPIILSLGVASQEDVVDAVHEIRKYHNEFVLLQCETKYPAAPENSNLALLQRLRHDFNCIVGLSDHTTSAEIVPTAIGAGAKVFEKHLKSDMQKSADGFFSINNSDFTRYVNEIRRAETYLGRSEYRFLKHDSYRMQNTRSIFASAEIQRGDIFSHDNIKVVRPGIGLHPRYLHQLLGTISKRNIAFGDPLSEVDLP